MMRKMQTLAGAIACAGTITFAGATHAANLSLNDATPGEITITWQGFELDGSVNGGSASNSGSATVSGETASFSGEWIVGTVATASPGVIYIVDPGQPDLVRARINGSWQTSTGTPIINITVTSAPFGGDLGTIPAAFSGLGIPMPDGSSGNINGLFRNPTTAAPVNLPSNLTIQYVGDLVPECEHATLVSQTPDQADANWSDADGSYEQADDFTFTQDVTIRSLRWWGLYAFSNTAQTGADMFTLRVYEDAAGLPAPNPVATFHLSNAVRAGTGQLVGGFLNEFAYAANLPAPLTLKANTRYWLAIVNDTTADTDDDWFWSSSNIGNNARAERNPPFTGGWYAIGVDRAIELCGNAMSLDCPTDFDGDGFTSGADLATLLANWGPCGPPLPLLAPMEPARLDMLTNPADDSSAATGAQR